MTPAGLEWNTRKLAPALAGRTCNPVPTEISPVRIRPERASPGRDNDQESQRLTSIPSTGVHEFFYVYLWGLKVSFVSLLSIISMAVAPYIRREGRLFQILGEL